MSKFWKEASSVIVVAKVSFPQGTISYPVHRVNRPNKNAVLTQKIKNERLCSPNFKILALRRSSKNSFFPDSYVFPGGNTDAADSSKDWLDLYEQYGLGKYVFELIASLSRKCSKVSIVESQREEVLKSISLRITGIRETFEESGVLLCKSKRAHSSQPSRWASYLSGHEIKNWQRKVQEDANEFISLCRHFECYPDIWSLQEWSNWLTPSDYTKRFNTVFFLATLDQMPTAFSSSSEINELKVHIFSKAVVWECQHSGCFVSLKGKLMHSPL
jgi:nucleoside diphosphate-linked moiety X motif protein 19